MLSRTKPLPGFGPRHVTRGVLGLLVIALLALTGAQSAYAAAPQPGVSCDSQSECEALALRCPGTVVQVVVRDAAGAPTLLGWCQDKKSPRLKCWGASGCEELEKICLKAKGTYKETVEAGGTVSGTCKLPPPPAPRNKVDIWCEGSADCTWLSGYCTAVGGEFQTASDRLGVYGACSYTPRSGR